MREVPRLNQIEFTVNDRVYQVPIEDAVPILREKPMARERVLERFKTFLAAYEQTGTTDTSMRLRVEEMRIGELLRHYGEAWPELEELRSRMELALTSEWHPQ